MIVLLLDQDSEQLATKAVQGAALPLESVDHVHGGDSLPLGVLSVGDGISDDVLQENPENSTSLLMAGLVMPWMLSLNTFL